MSQKFVCNIVFKDSEVKVPKKEVPKDDAFQSWLKKKKEEERIRNAKLKREMREENDKKEKARIEREIKKEKVMKEWFIKKEKEDKERTARLEPSEYVPKDRRALIFDSYDPQEVICRIRDCMFKPKTPPPISDKDRHKMWLKKAFNRKFNVEDFY